MKKIVARFHGRCKGCGESIAPGETILWAKDKGTRHIGCEEPMDKPAFGPASAPHKPYQRGQPLSR